MTDAEKITNLDKYNIVIKFYNAERWCWTHHLRFLAKVIWRLIYILFSCQIPPTTVLEKGVNIAHGLGIVIHQNTVVGKGTMIYQNVTIGSGNGPQIGKDCIIGCGACVLGDIRIGNRVKIGANSVVLSDVPDDSTVVGIPGKIIKSKTVQGI